MPILCNRSNDCGSGLFDFMQIRAPDDNKNSFPKNIKRTVFEFPQVAWPSGLRRWFKAPVISMAWVRIPPLPNLFLPWTKATFICTTKSTLYWYTFAERASSVLFVWILSLASYVCSLNKRFFKFQCKVKRFRCVYLCQSARHCSSNVLITMRSVRHCQTMV